MEQNNILEEINNKVPEALLSKYSKEIDNIILKNRLEIKKDAFLLKPKKLNFLIPLIINITAVILITAGLFAAGYFFDIQEQNIISNYAVINTVEGRLLLEYKQETEKKLRALNNEISKIEQRLLSITEEKNSLISEIDTIIAEKQKELEENMALEIEQERARLEEQGLSAENIELKIAELEETLQEEIIKEKETLRMELEKEYEIMQEDYQSLLNEYETTLKQVRSQREYLENEIEIKNQELETLSSHISRTERPPASEENIELEKLNEYRREQELIEEQISSYYTKIRENIQAEKYSKAEENIVYLSDYLNEEAVSRIPSVIRRNEFDEFILTSMQKLIDYETGSVTEITEVPEPVENTVTETEPIAENEDKQRLALLERIKFIQTEFSRYFTENPNLLASTSEEEFIELVEVKLLVKEILSSEPVSNEYPGISEKLEEYYSALGNEKAASGKYYALLNVLDLLEAMESSSSRIRHDWDNLNNKELKDLFLEIINKLEALLE